MIDLNYYFMSCYLCNGLILNQNHILLFYMSYLEYLMYIFDNERVKSQSNNNHYMRGIGTVLPLGGHKDPT